MRLFIGIPIGDAARAALLRATGRMRQTADGRYVDGDLYHITLAFLGELDEGRLREIQSAMAAAAADVQPVMLTLSRAGYFGRPDNAILYADVHGAQSLHPIADKLRRMLDAYRLPYDRKPFKAHITLARRVRASKELLGVAVEPIPFAAGRFTLFHSCRVAGRLCYLPIYEAPFEREDS